MADFTFAIVVPLASPIQPVATSTLDTEDTSRTAISSELGALSVFNMMPVEPGVNRGVCLAFRRVLARIQHKPENTRRRHIR